MDIKRRFIIEKETKTGGYEITVVAEMYSCSYMGKGGIYALCDKHPVLAVIKSSLETTIIMMDGNVLTASQAIEKVPDLKKILKKES